MGLRGQRRDFLRFGISLYSSGLVFMKVFWSGLVLAGSEVDRGGRVSDCWWCLIWFLSRVGIVWVGGGRGGGVNGLWWHFVRGGAVSQVYCCRGFREFEGTARGFP